MAFGLVSKRKYSSNIDTYLALIYKDSIDVGILEYFNTRNFERLTLAHSMVNRLTTNLNDEPNAENYAAFLNNLQKGYSEPNHKFIFLFLIDFINAAKFKIEFEDILEDTKILREKDNERILLLSAYEQHKLKFDNKEISRFNEIQMQQKDISIEKFIEKTLTEIETKKKNWIKSIAKAEIEKVVDEIIEYGVENENNIIALSSRWHSLKSKYNKGVMKEDEFNIENNKIVHALLDFIKNLKDTEGS